MADFVWDVMDVDTFKEEYTSSRDTKLAQACRRLVDSLVAAGVADGGKATAPVSMDQIEAMDEELQNWQIRQRDRKAAGENAEVIDLDGIARKVNADTDTHGIKAVRRQGKLAFGSVVDFPKVERNGKDEGEDA